jgi:hypothetical protein
MEARCRLTTPHVLVDYRVGCLDPALHSAAYRGVGDAGQSFGGAQGSVDRRTEGGAGRR